MKAPARRGRPRGRAGSAASSALLKPQISAHLQPDDAEDVETSSSGPLLTVVKQEASTPVDTSSIEDPIAEDHPSRQLRGGPVSRPVTKRKRESTPDVSKPNEPPTHVMWVRNFPKIAASAQEAITSHRNASLFAAPVKERDAPGYHDWILKPQDLKSIRAAIAAGNKAASAAATASGLDAGQPTLWLPIREDLIPPKGIINNDQYERELTRMFANAVMFNAEPDTTFATRRGTSESKTKEFYALDENAVMRDTIDMYKDVEVIIMTLRNAERRTDGPNNTDREWSTSATGQATDAPDELGEMVDPPEGVVKRRRKA